MSPTHASDNGVFLWLTYQAMRQAGLDCAAIFASVGMPDEPPDRQQRRINSPQQRFWEAAEQDSGDGDNRGSHQNIELPKTFDGRQDFCLGNTDGRG